MKVKASINKIYKPSEDVVARDVQGEFIIIPIASGVGDLEDEIFSLNETGRAIWGKLDGKKSAKNIAVELAKDFEAPVEEIEKDCLGLLNELLKRRMVIESKRS